MRPIVFRIVFAASLIACMPAFAGNADVVLVELFTSEGCSSCPPADNVLSGLHDREDVAVLGWHVDYWDYLGWEDRFGHRAATPRQRAYARAFGAGRIYTPQIVVGGETGFVGSDRLRAQRAIDAAHDEPSAELSLAATYKDDAIAVTVTVNRLPRDSRTGEPHGFLAITEDDLASEVTRGENTGRRLHHDGVVREVRDLGPVAKGFTQTIRIPMDTEWKRADLKAVLWVQDTRSLQVLGAAVAAPSGE